VNEAVFETALFLTCSSGHCHCHHHDGHEGYVVIIPVVFVNV